MINILTDFCLPTKGSASLYHTVVGTGSPSPLQRKLTVWPSVRLMLVGISLQVGSAEMEMTYFIITTSVTLVIILIIIVCMIFTITLLVIIIGRSPLYKYDIPVGFSPGITSPREDCCLRA